MYTLCIMLCLWSPLAIDEQLMFEQHLDQIDEGVLPLVYLMSNLKRTSIPTKQLSTSMSYVFDQE